MTSTEKPWQEWPAQIIGYAIKHINRDSDFDQRIGFLLLDVGVEAILKGYLELNEKVSNAQGNYHERKEAIDSRSFIKILEATQKAAGDKLRDIDIYEIVYFHGIRNSLYHKGDGLTIEKSKIKRYAILAAELLNRLMNVDVRAELGVLPLEKIEEEEIFTLRKEIHDVHEHIDEKLSQFSRNIRIATELIEPASLMPSFDHSFWNWYSLIDPELFFQEYNLRRYKEKKRRLGETFDDKLLNEIFINDPSFYPKMPEKLKRFYDYIKQNPMTFLGIIDHPDVETVKHFILSGVLEFSVDIPKIFALCSLTMSD